MASSYFVGLSCVFVCVHLRTFLVVTPPHCVCAVFAPLRRVNIDTGLETKRLPWCIS